jgi:hypothetical protein
MTGSDSVVETFEELRRRAAANPREARARLGVLLETGGSQLDAVLDLAAAPGEGRLTKLKSPEP